MIKLFKDRINILNKHQKTGNVLYISYRDQRLENNHAICYGYYLSYKYKSQFYISFPTNKIKCNDEQFKFMMEGISELVNNKFNLHIDELNNLKEKIQKNNITSVLIDYNPLREYRTYLKEVFNICNEFEIQCIEIDSHNVVPHNVLDVYKKTSSSVKTQLYKQFSKYFDLTINFGNGNDSFIDDTYEEQDSSVNNTSKPSNNVEDSSTSSTSSHNDEEDNYSSLNCTKDPEYEDNSSYMDESSTSEDYTEKDEFYVNLFENLVPHKYNKNVLNPKINFEKCKWFKGGHTAGMKVFNDFMENKFSRYSDLRNDPDEDVLSNLSPYLHFGQISTHKIIKLVYDNPDKKNLDIFLNEIFIWKETSEHYCYHEKNYDNIDGALPWAKQSLLDHSNDKREHLYDYETLKSGKTSDSFWNAAQNELIYTNKIHGYARMYWSKELVKWTKTPQEALNFCIKLNDTFSIDGNDPCGYMGIMWSICGNMDRGYKDRECSGKIRPMNQPKTHWYSRMWNNEEEIKKELSKRKRVGE
ncbi:deoxyribodipyrimidine photolyase [Vairimorpha apis BRL 01]|uniref:Deoxyribodipyrimidine photo-lyase n=1 Tax=Vairimorpha apis BRL 01 TaxID=1037528 RepID=T0MJS1_9MICR|nr:deoxyribodipyrimidine photolyase [Vairimorpha apis BRL 01]